MSEQAFKVSVPDSELDFLRKKLELTRFPDELDEAGWDYGVPLADVRRLVARWKDGFDWRASEAAINALPQFTRDIEVEGYGNLNIHYVHSKSETQNAIPLLYVHGWPGHFVEVTKLLPLLTSPSSDFPAFHVVAPSLPGFGLSETTKKKGFAANQYAEVSHQLMLSLGYAEYVTVGGDWGYWVYQFVAPGLIQHLYPNHAKAWHTTFPEGSPPKFTSNPIVWLQHLLTPYTDKDREGLKRSAEHWEKGTGYARIQATKPQTLGYSLADSPAGLLAWIYEKLVLWTDNYPWTDDEVLTWVSIYWFSRAGPAASIRIYYEFRVADDHADIPGATLSNPFGVSFFPKEIFVAPTSWAHTRGNLVFKSVHERGGHFPAYEEPELLASDLRKFFGKGGPAFGVVHGKDGSSSN
ncbi:alpha/beta-hydrolase [Panus rudis PR-1116 ss-1]|nr:alpha/beta-hydrolase [Panus rudis PR-1116 ss-1]